MAVGEEAIVVDALEAIGKHVLQKPADELMCFQTHDFLHATMSVIAPAEGDMGVAERDKAAVRDGDTVGVARKIGEHLFRPCEQRLSILPIITEIGSRSATPTIRCTSKGARSCGKRTQKGNAIFV